MKRERGGGREEEEEEEEVGGKREGGTGKEAEGKNGELKNHFEHLTCDIVFVSKQHMSFKKLRTLLQLISNKNIYSAVPFYRLATTPRHGPLFPLSPHERCAGQDTEAPAPRGKGWRRW